MPPQTRLAATQLENSHKLHDDATHAEVKPSENIPVKPRKRRSTKDIISDEQNTVLETLYECDTYPTKTSILQVVQETGLTEKEVRLWLTRKRRNMKRHGLEITIANTSIVSSTSTSTDTSSMSTLSTQSEPLNGTQSLIFRRSAFQSDPSLSQANSEPSLRSLRIIPFSAPNSVSTSLSLPSVITDISCGYMRAYTRSPSLGYIPIAFPFDSSTSCQDPSSRSSGSVVPSSSSSGQIANQVKRDNQSSNPAPELTLPSVPKLDLVSLDISLTANTSSRNADVMNQSTDNVVPKSKAPSLLDLLYSIEDDPSLIPPPSVLPRPEHPQTTTITQASSQTQPISRFPSSQINMSFEPSFRTHSTSVNAKAPVSLAPTLHTATSQSHAFGYSPISQNSVAFNINLYELAAMTKRVNVMSGPDAISGRSVLSTRDMTSLPETEDHSSAAADCPPSTRTPNAISHNSVPDFGDDAGLETDDEPESQEAITPHLSRDGLEQLTEPEDLAYVTMSEKPNEMPGMDQGGRDANALQENRRVVSV